MKSRIEWALLAAIILVPSLAHAQNNGAALCGRISSRRAAAECTQIVANQRVDSAAVEICGRISSNRQTVACARAVAGRSVPQAAVTLCGRISSNRETVACAQAVAGHSLDPAAVGVCGRISSNRQTTNCARAIVDKVYDPAEIAMCNRESSNRRTVDCMSRSGRRRGATPAARVAPPPRGGDVQVNLINDTDTVLTRVYVRAHTASRWPAATWRGALLPGMQVRINVPAGEWDVCLETADGHSTWWNPIQLSRQRSRLTVGGSVRDPSVFGAMECVRR